jgi:hypothetical protein
MILSISEILRNIAALPTREAKIATLRKYDHPALRAVLFHTFDPRVKWLLPSGPVPYQTATGAIDQQGTLYSEYKGFYAFVEGPCPNLTASKRQILFVQFLESLSADDAAMMESVKDKHLPWPGITPDIVNDAFPDLGILLVKEEPEPWFHGDGFSKGPTFGETKKNAAGYETKKSASPFDNLYDDEEPLVFLQENVDEAHNAIIEEPVLDTTKILDIDSLTAEEMRTYLKSMLKKMPDSGPGVTSNKPRKPRPAPTPEATENRRKAAQRMNELRKQRAAEKSAQQNG